MASTQQVLAEVRKRLEKKYSDDSELFPDFTSIKEIATIPSRSAIVNAVTGVGGFPRGRATEIYGPYSSGKTTLAIDCSVSCQQDKSTDPTGGTVLYVDYEHAFDAGYARQLGLNLSPDKFIFAQPTYLEQGAQIIDAFLDAGVVDMIVIDSAAAMTPKSQMEGEMDTDGGTQKGTQAALMSNFLAVATKKLNRGRRPAMIIINQTRAVISIGGPVKKNGPKEQSAAGNAIKFYTSMRLELAIIAQEGEEGRGTKGTDQVYTQNRVRLTCIKNKVAPPQIRGVIVIEYGRGINNIVSVAELAEARLGIMSGAGFFKYVGATPETSFNCRGREAFVDLLEKSPATLKEIERKVLDAIRSEQAQRLGLDKISITGKAKEVESNTPGVLILHAGPKQATTPPQDYDDDEPLDRGAPRTFDGPGLPVEGDPTP
jgi:recombination protein RecA